MAWSVSPCRWIHDSPKSQHIGVVDVRRVLVISGTSPTQTKAPRSSHIKRLSEIPYNSGPDGAWLRTLPVVRHVGHYDSSCDARHAFERRIPSIFELTIRYRTVHHRRSG